MDEKQKQIINKEILAAPPHEPGLLPRWLGEKGANVIIAGGMGQRAQTLFAQQKIKVFVGASSATPEEIVEAYLNDALISGTNLCDH
ncbi:MAG: NifB/NifX family molybdenum-iron cluster-binding protein [Pseudomonadota bacterium]